MPETIKPANAMPLGLLNNAIIEKRTARPKGIAPMNGIHPIKIEITAITKPATPNPFDREDID